MINYVNNINTLKCFNMAVSKIVLFIRSSVLLLEKKLINNLRELMNSWLLGACVMVNGVFLA